MKTPLLLLTVLLLLPVLSAQESPRWLVPERQAGGIALLGSAGEPVTTAVLDVGQGQYLSGDFLATSLVASRWQGADALPVGGGVVGMGLRVAPSAGVAAWTLTMDVSRPGEWFLVVGGLFRDDSFAHGPIEILASSAAGTVPLTFLGSGTWNDGVSHLTGALDWDAGTGSLSPAVGNQGDSGLAFFSLSNETGEVESLALSIAQGFPQGAGDEIFVAVGFEPIPEPSVIALIALGLGSLWRRVR
ncbi:PEP-CTERM sorting domain-containing protein [Roseibacillus ishigakijimensis]|uniref:PEP-CTERM sorting domain-containing protein n=1 Tax=Roseibacillus ishigakijimensis TaxID=454146 RepID=A0A934VI62_9BACT|nr:PEP-CTERM sorting domain-containing protein [Roseibacillus ishigakijimensis]MBK1834738.1 PEP-CTERM sorting domain-containing protein [Roseibacillus ishigakijimensis]